jgi:hypothetical protein
MVRHNRKRTRSRPRHRKANSIASQSSLRYSPSCQNHLHQNRSQAEYFHYSRYAIAPAGQRQQIIPGQDSSAVDAERLRIFGGEASDGVSLCGPMLQVVLDLFDGGLDYQDP